MEKTSSIDTAIQIQNVWKIFGNTSNEALDAIQNKNISKQEALEKFNSVIGVSNVSFNVKKGEIFCVMGLSGSGKSTLIRHINRLLEPTSGKIFINNQDVMQCSKENLQELVVNCSLKLSTVRKFTTVRRQTAKSHLLGGSEIESLILL